MDTGLASLQTDLITFIKRYQKKLSLSDPANDFESKILPYEKELKVEYVPKIPISNDDDDDGTYLSRLNTIYISKKITYPPRILFTKYHEFTHYLIDKYLSNIKEVLKQYDDNNYLIEESLSNKGASEFLLNDLTVTTDIPTLIGSPSILENLLEQVEYASSPAILYRIADRTKYKVICFILHNGINPLHIENNTLLDKERTKNHISPYIEYHFESPSVEYPLKRHFCLKNNHLLSNLLSTNRIEYTNEDTYIPYSQYDGKIPCKVTGFYSKKSQRFYGIFNLDSISPKSEDQLTFI